MFENITLIVVSFFSGIWNVLRDKSKDIRHKICVFMLGFGFCYGVALLSGCYGFSSDISAFLGYVCGVLSNQIYDALSRIVMHSPDLVIHKMHGCSSMKHNTKGDNND